MSEVHKYVGFVVVGLFAIGWVWGIGAWAGKRGPGGWFWRWLAVAQVVAGAEVLIGIVLLILGRRPDVLLHYAYGIFPVVALVIAHRVARQEKYGDRPWIPFAWAAFFCFGLTLRAVMTGLGVR